MVEGIVLDDGEKELIGDASDKLKVNCSEGVACQQQPQCLFCNPAAYGVEDAEFYQV